MSLEVCGETVREGDPDRYIAAMLAAPDKRGGLMALYAFNLEIARAPWASSEEMICEMRLQWWADAIDDLFAGTPRAHPVLDALAPVVEKYRLPQELFAGMVAARRFDIYRDGHPDYAAFERYISDTSGNLMQLAVQILGDGQAAYPVVADFAYAAGVANLLRALPVLYARGRHPVPVDCALDRNAVAAGKVPDNLVDSLRDISTDALARLQKARNLRASIPKFARPAMLAVRQPEVPLKLVLARPETALTAPLETSEFHTKASLLWRSYTGRW